MANSWLKRAIVITICEQSKLCSAHSGDRIGIPPSFSIVYEIGRIVGVAFFPKRDTTFCVLENFIIAYLASFELDGLRDEAPEWGW